MARSQTKIWITTSFIGFHRWKDAPRDVGYLSEIHRHRFGVRVEVVPRSKNDRAVEFHTLKKKVEGTIDGLNKQLEWSCEQIAERIGESLLLHNLFSQVSVSVDEDGECGAEITVIGV